MTHNFIINISLNIKKKFRLNVAILNLRDKPIEMLVHYRSIYVMKFIFPSDVGCHKSLNILRWWFYYAASIQMCHLLVNRHSHKQTLQFTYTNISRVNGGAYLGVLWSGN